MQIRQFLGPEIQLCEFGTSGPVFAKMFSLVINLVSDVSRSRATLLYPVATIPLLVYGASLKVAVSKHCRAILVKSMPLLSMGSELSQAVWIPMSGSGIRLLGMSMCRVSKQQLLTV